MPWKDQFGWTRAQLGGVIGLARLEGGIAGPITGWCVDTFGPRRMMFAGIGAMGGGFLLLSRISSITQLYLVFLAFLAIGSSFGTFRPLQVAIANWFMRRRGRAMGLLMSGSGLGGSLVFLLAILIERVGWQSAAVTAGILMWVIGLPLTAVVRHRPSDMGLNIDGDPDPEEGTGAPAETDTGDERPEQHARKWWQKDKRVEPDLGVWQALRTPVFWILALTYAIWAAMPGITTVHVAPFLQEQLELEYVTAVGALSFFVAASIIGRLGFGVLADYFDARIIMSGLFLFQGFGLFLFPQVTSIEQVPFYGMVFAIPYGGTIPMRSIIQGYFFGRRSFGTISGLLQFVDLPATVAAPIWVGWRCRHIARWL
jgi:sugar phosphate permease